MNKYFNDLCREQHVGRKFNTLDINKAKEMLKNCTDNWLTVIESLQEDSFEGKVNMDTFRNNVINIIRYNYNSNKN